MKGKKRKIIKDKKLRGEWAESVFIARAGEEGLAASKPWGDSRSYDCVVGSPGRFVAVQVKCTLFRSTSGEGYSCSTCSSHKRYKKGAFDYLAAYVIPEDVWYIIPAKEVLGRRSISLCTETGEAKYEPYREAWHLLREAAGMREESEDPSFDKLGAGFVATPARSRAPSDEEGSAEGLGEGGAKLGAGSLAKVPPGALGRMKASMNFFRRQLERGDVMPEEQDEET